MTETPTKVHIATRVDEPELLKLLNILYEENALAQVDWDRVKETLAKAWNKQGGLIGVIRGEGRELRAAIMVMLGKLWYTTDDHLEEMFSVVHPLHRKSNYAQALLDTAIGWSNQMKIPLSIGVLSNRRLTAKVRLYRRKLGPPAGAYFVHGAQWHNDLAPVEDFWKEIGITPRFIKREQTAAADMPPPRVARKAKRVRARK